MWKLEKIATEQPLQASAKNCRRTSRWSADWLRRRGFAESGKTLLSRGSGAAKRFRHNFWRAARREAEALSEFGLKLGASLSLDDALFSYWQCE